MKRVLTIAAKAALALSVLGIGAALALYPTYLSSPGEPDPKGYAFDLAEIRILAESMAGDKPNSIRFERVARFEVPEIATRAGASWRRIQMGVFSFQLRTGSGHAIIDACMDEADAKTMRAEFDPEAYARMTRAMSSATIIALTHEHVDHIGGLVKHPDIKALHGALRLTREQADNIELHGAPPFAEGALDGYEPLSYEKAVAIAPGIVLIKSPGHTRGSQMIFVQLASGKEVLFLGDVAWMAANVTQATPRPKLVSNILPGKEDRAAVHAQLQFLQRLLQDEPRIALIAGHDLSQVESLANSGLLQWGFQSPAETPAL